MTASTLYRGTAYWHLAVRICGRLIADGGRTHTAKIRNLGLKLGITDPLPPRADGTSRGSRRGVAARRAMQSLEELGLVKRDGMYLLADNLGDVAAWLADELDAYFPSTSDEFVPVGGLDRLNTTPEVDH